MAQNDAKGDPGLRRKVAQEPTRADAKRALAELMAVFEAFPLVDGGRAAPGPWADRGDWFMMGHHVPVAAILTVLAREAIRGPVPAFVFDASGPGVGKTLLADVVLLIVRATGFSALRDVGLIGEDFVRRLAKAAIRREQLLVLDDGHRVGAGSRIGGPVIDGVLTSETIEVRELGQSEIRQIPWNTVLFFTGNNVRIEEDTRRRVVVARLEQRDGFFVDEALLHHVVLGRRYRLTAAALTILRAHAAAGSPVAAYWWPSFDAWCHVVPSAIAWAAG